METSALIFIGICGFIVAYLPRFVLSLLGFQSEGVTAGSVAAFIQAIIGNVPFGGFFATLQHMGAAGLPTKANLLLFTVGAALGLYLLL